MAETPPSTEPLRMLAIETAGYCDPVTGACVWPGAEPLAPASDEQS